MITNISRYWEKLWHMQLLEPKYQNTYFIKTLLSEHIHITTLCNTNFMNNLSSKSALNFKDWEIGKEYRIIKHHNFQGPTYTTLRLGNSISIFSEILDNV